MWLSHARPWVIDQSLDTLVPQENLVSATRVAQTDPGRALISSVSFRTNCDIDVKN